MFKGNVMMEEMQREGAFKELGDAFIRFFTSNLYDLSLFINASNFNNEKSLDQLLVEFIQHMDVPLDQSEYLDSLQKYLNDIFREIRNSHTEGQLQGVKMIRYLDEKMKIHKKLVMRQQLERFNLCKEYIVKEVEKALEVERV